MEGLYRSNNSNGGKADKSSAEKARVPAQPKQTGARPAPVEDKNRVLERLIAHLKSDN